MMKKNTCHKGFTLIEMMVATALFTIIMTIGIGAALSIIQYRNQTEIMRQATDTLSFALEDMTRNIRLGQGYHCYSSGEVINTSNPIPSQDCPPGTFALAVGFNSVDGIPTAYQIAEDLGTNAYVLYKSKGVNGLTSITAPNIFLDEFKSGFSVRGASNGDNLQPIVVIRLAGEVRDKGLSSPFDFQTTVTQRVLDQ